MKIFFKISSLGIGLGPEFILYDNYSLTIPFKFSSQQLLDGVEILVNDLATNIYVKSTGVFCNDPCVYDVKNYVIPFATTTTTTSSSTTTTTTNSSTTTSTTTTSSSTTTSTTTSNGTTTTSTSSTTTTTSTSSTTTSTTTTPPPVCNCYRVQNEGGSLSTYSYTACNGNIFDNVLIGAGVTVYICAVIDTVVTGPEVTELNLATSCLDSPECIPID